MASEGSNRPETKPTANPQARSPNADGIIEDEFGNTDPFVEPPVPPGTGSQMIGTGSQYGSPLDSANLDVIAKRGSLTFQGKDATNDVDALLKVLEDKKARGTIQKLIKQKADETGTQNVVDLLGMIGSDSIKASREASMWKGRTKLAIAGSIVAVIVAVGVQFAINYGANEMAKESHVNDQGSMTTKGGEVVSTSNAEMRVDANGVLVAQSSSQDSDEARRLSETPVALKMSTAKSHGALSSTMSNEALESLKQLSLTNTQTGEAIAISIVSNQRVSSKASKCGSLLFLVTTEGRFTLDDYDIHVDEQLTSFLATKGFNELLVTVSEVSGSQSRRLQGGLTSLESFFDLVEAANWECESQPLSRPTGMNATRVTRTRFKKLCEVPESCISKVKAAQGMKLPGVVEEGDELYLTWNQTIATDGDSSATILSFPGHPLQYVFQFEYEDQQVRGQVSKDGDGLLLWCSKKEQEPKVGPDEEPDMSFEGIIVEGDVIYRRFLIDMKKTSQNATVESMMESGLSMNKIEYWDRDDNAVPYRIISTNFDGGNRVYMEETYSISYPEAPHSLLKDVTSLVYQSVLGQPFVYDPDNCLDDEGTRSSADPFPLIPTALGVVHEEDELAMLDYRQRLIDGQHEFQNGSYWSNIVASDGITDLQDAHIEEYMTGDPEPPPEEDNETLAELPASVENTSDDIDTRAIMTGSDRRLAGGRRLRRNMRRRRRGPRKPVTFHAVFRSHYMEFNFQIGDEGVVFLIRFDSQRQLESLKAIVTYPIQVAVWTSPPIKIALQGAGITVHPGKSTAEGSINLAVCLGLPTIKGIRIPEFCLTIVLSLAIVYDGGRLHLDSITVELGTTLDFYAAKVSPSFCIQMKPFRRAGKSGYGAWSFEFYLQFDITIGWGWFSYRHWQKVPIETTPYVVLWGSDPRWDAAFSPPGYNMRAARYICSTRNNYWSMNAHRRRNGYCTWTLTSCANYCNQYSNCAGISWTWRKVGGDIHACLHCINHVHHVSWDYNWNTYRKIRAPCAADSHLCLQRSPGWNWQYNCHNSVWWCGNWGKDVKRCCPNSCRATPICTRAECYRTPGSGTCIYPNYALRR
jgi:hypothetical protein